MKIKNQLIVTGLIAVFVDLGAAAAQANQLGSYDQDAYLTISAEATERINLFPSADEVEPIFSESESDLNNKAAEACSGRAFHVDASSIRQTQSFAPIAGGRLDTVTTTARVFCL